MTLNFVLDHPWAKTNSEGVIFVISYTNSTLPVMYVSFVMEKKRVRMQMKMKENKHKDFSTYFARKKGFLPTWLRLFSFERSSSNIFAVAEAYKTYMARKHQGKGSNYSSQYCKAEMHFRLHFGKTFILGLPMLLKELFCLKILQKQHDAQINFNSA